MLSAIADVLWVGWIPLKLYLSFSFILFLFVCLSFSISRSLSIRPHGSIENNNSIVYFVYFFFEIASLSLHCERLSRTEELIHFDEYTSIASNQLVLYGSWMRETRSKYQNYAIEALQCVWVLSFSLLSFSCYIHVFLMHSNNKQKKIDRRRRRIV